MAYERKRKIPEKMMEDYLMFAVNNILHRKLRSSFLLLERIDCLFLQRDFRALAR